MITLLEPVSAAADVGETLKQTVSASRLNCWSQCRLKFYFRYVLKLRGPKTPSLHFGTVVHQVLQAWNLRRWRRQPADETALQAVFATGWATQVDIDWDGTETAQRELAWQTLTRYFAETPIPPDELPEAVEVPVTADLSQHGLPQLIGVLDLVRSNRRIVDFKSAGKTPDPELTLHQHGVQLDCYAVLYRAATGEVETERELHHLIKTKVPKVVLTTSGPMTELRQTRLFRLLESYVDGVDRRDFVPSVGLGCAGCELFAECQAWDGGRHV